ncbi:uncharacterized protein KGF55_002401 [Candida pseudojiufengensis]|uniref:uncharacterized protein n=1 Tax=Candida pseudojiufengensis TaxID=497109 RepID=UPI0022251C88|nr:uncharacterized protein KGF55_002401 [Candida pseudojiufengensis]KAI5963521.1 hypothetical protein KGF55_002401 [Candida pseudojiufengensis]
MFQQQQQQQQGFNQQNQFHYCNAPIDNTSSFFNPEVPQEICPNVWLGPYQSLINESSTNNTSFITNSNVKVIINCGTTMKFLNLVENSKNVSISSDILILSLDPSFKINEEEQQQNELIKNFISKFNKILQNYINSFYLNSPIKNLIYKLPQHKSFQIKTPILNDLNLKIQLFKIIRLISIFKLINQNLQILVVSEDGNLNLSTGVLISYIMDNYKFNFTNSFKFLKLKRPSINDFNFNYYDDLLIIENLKKFYFENVEIKLNDCNLMVNKCKRSFDDDEGEEVEEEEMYDDLMRDEILVGGGINGEIRNFRRRRLN